MCWRGQTNRQAGRQREREEERAKRKKEKNERKTADRTADPFLQRPGLERFELWEALSAVDVHLEHALARFAQ